MKAAKVIYENGDHRWLAIARDIQRPKHLIDTNEYVVAIGEEAILLDPGGSEIFPAVFSALCTECDPRRINKIFVSHQDPDVVSSLSMWIAFNPQVKCHLSWLWTGFVSHFGGTRDTFVSIPDEGADIEVGREILKAIPAHHLHSSGNFHLYDPRAKILFSGDVGAALLPVDESSLFVENFDNHIAYVEGFHRRWMGSERAKRDWCARVSDMDIDMLCPQHGSIYRGADVRRFVDWFAELEVGLVNS